MSSAGPPGGRGRVLVTGAGGFVGRRLVRALAGRGWRVRAVSRSLPAAPEAPGVEHVAADLADTAALPALVGGADAVCHLAAFLPPDMGDSAFAERCFQVNALATLRLAEAVLAAGAAPGPGAGSVSTTATPGAASAGVPAGPAAPRPFVFTSSANAYPAGAHPVTEDAPLHPAARATYYLASKLLAELYLEHLAHTRGLPLTVLRLSAVYGPGMPEGAALARFLSLAAAGQPLTVHHGGVPATDFVWVDDVVDLLVRALERPAPGVYNAGSGEHTSLLALARAACAAHPDRAAGVRVQPAAGEPPPGFAALNVDRARRTFGWAPRTLAEGLLAFRREREHTP